MAACRRCPGCRVDWPTTTAYTRCPVCEGETKYDRVGHPMDDKTARKTASYLKFDRYYVVTRGVDSDFEGDPAEDPNRAAIPVEPCATPHEDGFICWNCDEIPRRLPAGTLWALTDGSLVLDAASREQQNGGNA